MIYRLLGGLAAVLIVLALVYGQGRASLKPTLQRAEARAEAWKANAGRWRANSAAWRRRYGVEAGARLADHGRAVAAIAAEAEDCAGRVARARRTEDGLRRLLARPVAIDARACPAPAIWGAADLRPAMRPEVK